MEGQFVILLEHNFTGGVFSNDYPDFRWNIITNFRAELDDSGWSVFFRYYKAPVKNGQALASSLVKTLDKKESGRDVIEPKDFRKWLKFWVRDHVLNHPELLPILELLN